MEKLTDTDKIYHFGVCMLASILSPMFALGLAIGKEYGDSKATGNHWCWMDLLADLLGTLIGGIIHCLIVKSIAL